MLDISTGSAVTIGLVVICFSVSGAVLGIAGWINHKIEGGRNRHEAFRLEIARDYLSRDGARELVQGMVAQLEARFDALAEKLDMINDMPQRPRRSRTSAPRRKTPRKSDKPAPRPGRSNLPR